MKNSAQWTNLQAQNVLNALFAKFRCFQYINSKNYVMDKYQKTEMN